MDHSVTEKDVCEWHLTVKFADGLSHAKTFVLQTAQKYELVYRNAVRTKWPQIGDPVVTLIWPENNS